MRIRKFPVGLLSLTLASGVGVTLAPTAVATPTSAGAATAAPAAAAPLPASAPKKAGKSAHDLPSPLEDKRRELREQGLTKLLSGTGKAEKRGASTVMKVGSKPAQAGAAGASSRADGDEPVDQYVELGRETTDRVFGIIVEFGNRRHPDYPDKDTNAATPGPTRFNGPLHNQIPRPDRRVDNSTVWQADYNREHYRNIYFGNDRSESVKAYYERQSSGRYSISGDVSDWVKVQYNEARYGRSSDVADTDPIVCAAVVCANTWNLIQDAANEWARVRRAAGRTEAQIAAELATYDKWDRYDFDSDGNFNERDGYIDHFQIVHAGGDEADGDPYQGEDAIWSHRWYVFQQGIGTQGPSGGLKGGGTEIGNSDVWIGDYTIQPENGGRSVFKHEYGHDLGLPDHYDTSGGGDNAVNWWTLMAQSRVGARGEALGTRAADLGAWDKLQLGWLDYEIVPAGTRRTLELGPHEYNSAKPQAVAVPLPAKKVTTQLGAPRTGQRFWYSGSGDDLDNTMSRRVAVPTGSPTLSFYARYDIEDCGPDPCDYAYVEVDSGSGFRAIPGSITKAAEGNGIDGTAQNWTQATFNLSAFVGRTVNLRVRYRTDGAASGNATPAGEATADGIAIDDIRLNGFTDGAESGANGWTLDGFTASTGTETKDYFNAYLASNRSYVSYDKYLETGPYNFGFTPARPDYVEHFPYQEGLLVTYWDTSFNDNNESEHPGQGLILPIDSHPDPIYRLQDGQPWRGRIQTYDAPFSLQRADSFTLHNNGAPSYIRGQAAQPVFDDRRSYWNSVQPNIGVKVPNAGVRMTVRKQAGTSMTVRIDSTK